MYSNYNWTGRENPAGSGSQIPKNSWAQSGGGGWGMREAMARVCLQRRRQRQSVHPGAGKAGILWETPAPTCRRSSYQGYRSSKAWWSLWTPQDTGRQKSLPWKEDTGLHSFVILSFVSSPEGPTQYSPLRSPIQTGLCVCVCRGGVLMVPKRKKSKTNSQNQSWEGTGHRRKPSFQSISLERFKMLYP